MFIRSICFPVLKRNLLTPSRLSTPVVLRNASSWTRMRQFLKQHGTVFLVVKFGSFTPLMLLCYKIPSAFGYTTISDFILAQGKKLSGLDNEVRNLVGWKFCYAQAIRTYTIYSFKKFKRVQKIVIYLRFLKLFRN